MINDNKPAQENKIIFPENIPEIIDSVVEKYNLETLEQLLESKISEEEFEKKWENIPGPRIAKIIKEFSQGEIKSGTSLVNILAERLNISKELAQQLAEDLQKQILNLLQIGSESKETEETKIVKEITEEKTTSSTKPDVYRESTG